MKICHMTSAHPNLDKRIFYKECFSLKKAGYETVIIAQGASFEKEGISIIGVPKIKHGRLERVFKTTMLVYIEALKQDADIYHIHDPELLPYAFRLKKRGKVVIFDSHEDFFTAAEVSYYIPKLFRKFIGLIVKRYLIKASRVVDAIISVTPHICEKYMRYNSNTFLVTNYPVISEEEKSSTSNIQGNSKTVVFAGGISAGGNHIKIINAIDKIANAKYLLAGFGDVKYINSLTQLKGWEKVDYRGHIQYEEVGSLLNDSQVGIILPNPSITTGFEVGTLGNTKMFEYMRAGLPVICTDFILWDQIIKEYNCGISVNPEDEEAIYQAMTKIFENKEKTKKMGENAKRAIMEKYNWETQEKILLEIYANLEKNIVLNNITIHLEKEEGK